MQTFLPCNTFVQCAKSLDWRRLGKQRVEAMQILVALRDPWAVEEYIKRRNKQPGNGWMHHSVTRSWAGFELNLRQYLRACILEWIRRGYRNTMVIPEFDAKHNKLPKWATPEFQRSHRQLLYRKAPLAYPQWSNE